AEVAVGGDLAGDVATVEAVLRRGDRAGDVRVGGGAAGVEDDRVDQVQRVHLGAGIVKDAAAQGGLAGGGVGSQGVVDQRRDVAVEDAAALGVAGRGRDVVAQQGGAGHREFEVVEDAAALGVARGRAGAVVGEGVGGHRQNVMVEDAAALG